MVIENAEKAIEIACEQTGARINNFTAAPKYLGQNEKGAHEWVVEFERDPDDMEAFVEKLDAQLREINSDYDAKRYRDMALTLPIVHKAAPGTFYQWMKGRGKLGGQHKVPRLSNSREYLDDILKMMQVVSD